MASRSSSGSDVLASAAPMRASLGRTLQDERTGEITTLAIIDEWEREQQDERRHGTPSFGMWGQEGCVLPGADLPIEVLERLP
jgi:hypothetical protein